MNNHEFPQNFWKDKNETEPNVLAELVHETKLPQLKILKYSKLLLDNNDLPDEFRQEIDVIFRAAEYLESVLDAGLIYYSSRKNQ